MTHQQALTELSVKSPGWLLGGVIGLLVIAAIGVIIASVNDARRAGGGKDAASGDPADAPPDGADGASPARSQPGSRSSGTGIIRALLALVLVGAVVLLAAAALTGAGTEQTANLLIGGVVASAGSAIAFYFATRSADDASVAQQNLVQHAQTVQRDIATHAQDVQRDVAKNAQKVQWEAVPALRGGTFEDARAVMSQMGLVLALPSHDGHKLNMNGFVRSQNYEPGTAVPVGTVISVS